MLDQDKMNQLRDRLRLVQDGYDEPEDPFGDHLLPPMDVSKPPGPVIPVLTMEQLAASAAAVKWLVKGVIPAESIGILFGASGTFKSFLALDLGLHIGHGLQWLGRKTQKGKVIYVAAEGGAGLWRRIDAWHRLHGLIPSDADMLVIPAAIDLSEYARDVADAIRAATDQPVALIVIDTLSQTFSGEENSATEVAAYLRGVSTNLRAAFGASVLVIHHSGHVDTERPRGSSALRANVDFMYGCHRDEKELLATLSCLKQKDGDQLDDQMFAITVSDLGQDEDGDTITSLVASAIMSPEEQAEAVKVEMAKGRGGAKSKILALAETGMHVDSLRKAFLEDHPGDSNAQRQAWFKAKDWAVKKGFLEVVNGTVLVTKPSNG